MAHFLMVEGWVGESGNLILPLLEELGHTYTLVTRNPKHYYRWDGQAGSHPLFQNAAEVIETETNDIPQLIERVRNLRFDGVISVCDYYFDAVNAISSELNLPCPLPKNLKNIRQKHFMRASLDRAGVPNAKYRLAHTWDEVLSEANEMGYPFVVKPVDLGSSSFVRIVHNENELYDAFNALDGFQLNYRDQERNHTILLEEFLKGEEISVECVVYRGEITVIGSTDKSLIGYPFFIENGHMFPADISSGLFSETTDYIKRVLRAVEFDNGVAHIEVKLTERGPRIVEINPRTPGNFIIELIAYVTGLNLLKVFVELALGEAPDLQRKETDIKSAAVKFLTPPRAGTIEEIRGVNILRSNPNIVRCRVADYAGRQVSVPVDNNCYMGHVIAVDREDHKARLYAEQALEQLELIYVEESDCEADGFAP